VHVERRDGGVASDARRISAVVALCLFALPFSFIAGSAFLGLLPLGCAVWLIATSQWTRHARISVAVAAVAGTIGLFILVLSQLNFK